MCLGRGQTEFQVTLKLGSHPEVPRGPPTAPEDQNVTGMRIIRLIDHRLETGKDRHCDRETGKDRHCSPRSVPLPHSRNKRCCSRILSPRTVAAPSSNIRSRDPRGICRAQALPGGPNRFAINELGLCTSPAHGGTAGLAMPVLFAHGSRLRTHKYLAGHAEPRTTQRLHDRRQKKVTRSIVERISI